MTRHIRKIDDRFAVEILSFARSKGGYQAFFVDHVAGQDSLFVSTVAKKQTTAIQRVQRAIQRNHVNEILSRK